MTSNQPFPQSSGPLTIGNVVNASVRIYKDNFKTYYVLVLQGLLWLFVPIYGWAKYATILGLISRLVFYEVMSRPERVGKAEKEIKPQMWNFFLTGIINSLILSGVFIGMALIFLIFGLILSAALSALLGDSIISIVLIIIGVLIAVLFLLVISFWMFCRLSLYELSIAVENEGDPVKAIARSWKLTDQFFGRLQGIYLVAFLITIPVAVIVQLAVTFAQIILTAFLTENSGVYIFLYLIFVFGITIFSQALFIPFWQAIKAIIYYDLRSRKEGIDLQKSL